jgi:hypothetical protein
MKLNKLPSLQFVITDRMSLLLLLSLNGRSIPLKRRSLQGENGKLKLISSEMDQAEYKQGDFFYVLYSLIQHSFICHPSDSIVSKDAGIEPRTGIGSKTV